MPTNSDYITVEQMAAIFDVDHRTIRSWIHRGDIPERFVARKGPGITSAYLIHISAVNMLESEFGLIADLSRLDNNRNH